MKKIFHVFTFTCFISIIFIILNSDVFFKMTRHSSPSSSSSSTGLMTTGGWVGLGTFSWVSVLMTPLSCGLVGFAVGAGTWLTWSSCGISSFSFRTTCPVKMIKRPVYLFELFRLSMNILLKNCKDNHIPLSGAK